MFLIVDVPTDPTLWFKSVDDSTQLARVTNQLRKNIVLRTEPVTSPQLFRKFEHQPTEVRRVIESFIRTTPRAHGRNHFEGDFKIGTSNGSDIYFENVDTRIFETASKRQGFRTGQSVSKYWQLTFQNLATISKKVDIYDSYAYKLIRNGKSLCIQNFLSFRDLEVVIHTDVNKADESISDHSLEAKRLFDDWERILINCRNESETNAKSTVNLYHPTRFKQHDRKVIFTLHHLKIAIGLDQGIDEFERDPLPVPRTPDKVLDQALISDAEKCWSSIPRYRKFGKQSWMGSRRLLS